MEIVRALICLLRTLPSKAHTPTKHIATVHKSNRNKLYKKIITLPSFSLIFIMHDILGSPKIMFPFFLICITVQNRSVCVFPLPLSELFIRLSYEDNIIKIIPWICNICKLVCMISYSSENWKMFLFNYDCIRYNKHDKAVQTMSKRVYFMDGYCNVLKWILYRSNEYQSRLILPIPMRLILTLSGEKGKFIKM